MKKELAEKMAETLRTGHKAIIDTMSELGVVWGIVLSCLVVITDRLVHHSEHEGKWVPLDRKITPQHRTYDV